MPGEDIEELQLNDVLVEQFSSNAVSEITLVIAEESVSEVTASLSLLPSLKYDRDIDDGSVEVIPSKTTFDKTVIKPISPFPSLEYDIASKKRSIVISACLVFIINGLIPVVLYYILQYGTTASRDTVINIVEISATSTTLQWPWRLWVLLRRGGERAPANRAFLTWDVFQWSFLIGIVLVSVLTTLAGIYDSMRWYMFGFVALLGAVAVVFVFSWILTYTKVRIPLRMSSLTRGTVFRPALYFVIEDLTACDGGAGRAYRERLDVRWQSSPLFQKLLMDITLVSGIAVLIQTGLQFVILFATPEIVFVTLSTIVLWGWFGLTLLWGWKFAARRLQEERDKWEENLIEV